MSSVPSEFCHVESRFVAASDGLSLHVRCYVARENAQGLPVLCLPGLTRNEADFEALARYLTAGSSRPRAVFALDPRGRGQSGYDPDWRNYNPATELSDVLAVAKALGLDRAAFIGTSRGGILTMLLAQARPQLIGGVVLNDIGPVIEPAGLIRIKGYVGQTPAPHNMGDGARILRELFADQFPGLQEADWLAWARRNWKHTEGGLVVRYDPKLALILGEIGPDHPIPSLWPQFEALPQSPMMVIRGALSDILSAETVVAMRRRRPDIEAVEICDQGHAPLLAEPAILGRISDFLHRCDRANVVSDR